MHCAQFLLRRFMRFASRKFSVLSSSSDAIVDVKSFFPSYSFMKKFIRRPSHREKLSSLISELQIYLEVFGADSLPKFDDSMWSTYFSIWSIEERCEFLNDLRLQQKSKPSTSAIIDKEKISMSSLQETDDGEITYAAGFNSFIDLRGQYFRRAIDRMYGSRLLSLERCGEMLPKLVIDCRFLAEYSVTVQSTFARQIQALHESNWTSLIPFNISVANFRPDGQLSEIIKRHLLFHYGPPSLSNSFSAHPFAPALTARSVLEACGVSSSDALYISWRATKFLPEVPPSNVRAVVVCASNDLQPWSSSVSAAEKDGIIAYRLPLERYARFTARRKFFSLQETSSVIRSYFHGGDLGAAITKAVEFLPKKSYSTDSAEKDLFERYKNTIQLAAAKTKEESRSVNFKKSDASRLLSKGPRVHRYTREERSDMRHKARMS